jgi:ppGpp synthetase/RelA/SpoT-type nucleotidyltranferase
LTPNEYLALTRPHRRLLQQLVVDLGFYIEDVGPLAIFSVEHRVKSYESALTKARRMQKPVEQLYDLAGLRIVVGTEPEVAVAKYFFRLKEIVKDLTIRREWVVEHSNGYRATHLVVGFGGHYTRSVFPVEVEIQIPTILEHAFNFLSHSWTYKAARPPGADWQQKFRSVASKLRRIDIDLASLHDGAMSEKRAEDAAKLTPFAYREIAQELFVEDVPLQHAIDFVRQVTDRGVSTNEQLRAFFRREDVAKAWAIFVGMAEAGSSFARSITESRVMFWHSLGLDMSLHDNWVALAEKEIFANSVKPG